VIAEIKLHGMDGFDFLLEITRRGLCRCVAFICENSDFSYAQHGIVLGALDYLAKPIEEFYVRKLLARAKLFLDYGVCNANTFDMIMRDRESMFAYLTVEEKKLLSAIGKQKKDIPNEFVYIAKFAEMLVGTDDGQLYMMIGGLYDAIISEIFRQYNWLSLYFSDTYFERRERFDKYESFVGEYRDKIAGLLDIVGKLFPPNMPEMISNICKFILNNPESEISLQHVTEKFFLNYTYLSNLFKVKMGRRFNEYITQVKMQRACHLLRHSELKISEICSNLGYRDTEYFSRLFKNFSGKTPSTYRKI
jgi:two-component system response regulator YesN